MKIFLVILSFFTLSNGSNEIQSDYKLDDSELIFIRENYDWNKSDLIIINFREPRDNFWYDSYKNLENSNNWWNKFYSHIDLVNTRNIFIYSDSKIMKSVIDFEKHYPDDSKFFLNKFFNKNNTCFGLLVINKNGNYLVKNGEYTKTDILTMINRLQ
ncbi:hypothetical protein BC962_3292 [Gillisia mitskevichiae]|uniref:Uncharacterized protein n=1 Tax=Gillisia mitskevichiae TaxID=270921 RepID=A0A495NZ87_9FLAO|nr:hypothetical protein [Gillisia mitskevichiae]RKS42478.1 hypothetical protein BC962_3292 [Gillisia mitskevichiae]